MAQPHIHLKALCGWVASVSRGTYTHRHERRGGCGVLQVPTDFDVPTGHDRSHRDGRGGGRAAGSCAAHPKAAGPGPRCDLHRTATTCTYSCRLHHAHSSQLLHVRPQPATPLLCCATSRPLPPLMSDVSPSLTIAMDHPIAPTAPAVCPAAGWLGGRNVPGRPRVQGAAQGWSGLCHLGLVRKRDSQKRQLPLLAHTLNSSRCKTV